MKAIFIAITLFLTCAQAAPPRLPEEEILEVTTQTGNLLSDPILALNLNGEIYLPLLDLARTLGIRVEQPAENQFQIYVGAEESRELDITNCGRDSKEPVCKNFLEVKKVTYVSTAYLKTELQWPLEVDLKNLRLTVRVAARSEEIAKREADEKPLTIERKNFDYPSLRAEGIYISPSDSHAFSVYAAHSLLKQDSHLFFFEQDGFTRTRWTLSQRMVEEDRSPLAPKSYEAVSTQTLDMKYLFAPTQIYGVKVSNLKYDDNIFDTRNIYQKGPPRWKVELYLNGVYLGETLVDLNGDFSFLDVPLFYGENRIVYRFTSPLGKIVEVPETYNISSDFQGANRLRYQMSYGQMEDSADYIGGFQASYGVSSYISVQAGFAEFPLLNQRERYSLMGVSYLQPSYSISTLRLDSTSSDGSAWSVMPKANVGGLLLSAEYSEFDKFRSLLINKSSTIDQIGLTKVSALTSVRGEVPVTAQIQFLENRYITTPRNQEAQLRVYTMLDRKSLLAEVTQAWPTTINPDVYLEFGDYHSSFRAKYGVLIHEDKYSKSRVGIEAMLPRETYFTVDLESPVRISDSAYVVGLSRIFWDLQTEINYTGSANDHAVSLIVSTNIKTSAQGVRLTQDESYLQGNIEIFAFVDENANGKFDEGEKPFPRLRILHVQRQKDYETNKDGQAHLTGMNPYQRVTLEIVKESITNIFLTAQDIKSDYILTPAQNLRVEIPVMPSFDVRGHLENSYFKKLVPMVLLNKEGKVVAQTNSNARGIYRFDDVPAGEYEVRVEEEFVRKNRLVVSPDKTEISVLGKAGIKTAPTMGIISR
jgi:hypothetical protein